MPATKHTCTGDTTALELAAYRARGAAVAQAAIARADEDAHTRALAELVHRIATDPDSEPDDAA
jgi:hypothetical protein